MEIIKVSNLSKAYKGGVFKRHQVNVLKKLNLSIQQGEVFGLLGKNGAGKTSLIRILLGLLSFEKGQCEVFGDKPKSPKKNSRIGYLPEDFSSFGFLTGRQFLDNLGNIASSQNNPEIPRLIQKLNFDNYIDRKIKKYSKGTKQKLLLIHAFYNDPDLLILDEPTDGLDPMAKDIVQKLLKQAKNDGKTILINSHLLAEVEPICDRLGILSQGRISEIINVENLKKKETLFDIKVNSDEFIPKDNHFKFIKSDENYHYISVDNVNITEAVKLLENNNIKIISIDKNRFSLEKEVLKRLNE
jgi:ABC-2 type transport system ATP-binding protein